jgi:magnesium transporter
LAAEHDEDLARLSGFTHDVAAARHASVESVGRRFRHRLPWLLLGLVGATLSADLVGSFKGQLDRNVILAFFIPGVVYMADAVGTQTETLVVRGLSIGVGIGQVAARELLTGLLVGMTMAAAFVPVGLWRWGEGDVVVAVALSLLAACSTATLIAMALPWLLHRLGRDPAYGSGPLATVVQDLLSVVIYLGIAGILVH